MSTPASSPQTGGSARVMSIIGIVLGVAAIIILPIVLGPIGAILGFVANAKGDKPLGLYVGIGCIITTIIGIALGALLVANA